MACLPRKATPGIVVIVLREPAASAADQPFLRVRFARARRISAARGKSGTPTSDQRRARLLAFPAAPATPQIEPRSANADRGRSPRDSSPPRHQPLGA
jgi:hypothetical protein